MPYAVAAWTRTLNSVVQTAPTRPLKTSNRQAVIILLAVAVFFLLAILVSQTAFDLTLLRPGNNQQIVVFLRSVAVDLAPIRCAAFVLRAIC